MDKKPSGDVHLDDEVVIIGDEEWIVIREDDLQKTIRAVEDKANALHAHNAVRVLHGVDLLEWDDELATEAAKWAMHLAQTDSGLSHSSPLITHGENIYISRGTLEPSRSHHAVLLWYKGIEHFDFQVPGFNLACGSFSQLIWKECKALGVGIAFREDTRTTYIVAQYSPPGNTCYAGSYEENVCQPAGGMPPKLPRLDELASPQPPQDAVVEAPYGWAKGIFRSMCKWCTFTGPKPVESWSGCPTLPEKCDSKQNESEPTCSDNTVNSAEDKTCDSEAVPTEKCTDSCETDEKIDKEQVGSASCCNEKDTEGDNDGSEQVEGGAEKRDEKNEGNREETISTSNVNLEMKEDNNVITSDTAENDKAAENEEKTKSEG